MLPATEVTLRGSGFCVDDKRDAGEASYAIRQAGDYISHTDCMEGWMDGWKDGRVEKGSELRRSQKCIGCALIKKRRRCKIREKRCCRSEKGQVAATATACHASPHSQSPIDTGKNSRFLPEALSIAIPFLLSRARECRSLRLQLAMGMQEFALNLHSIYFALFCH